MREKLFDLMMRDPCPSPVICDPNCKYYKSHHCHAERYADHLIANDVVPVVRCKYCKHFVNDRVLVEHCRLHGIPVDVDDFCSYGERRTDDAEN